MDDPWKNKLDEKTYNICRLGHTEPAFSGKFLHNIETGSYHCICCQALLFDSVTKFNSGCGWPSFDQAVENSVKYLDDFSHGMQRVEIRCNQCDSHLGHVFEDGPTSTGKRYCVNSISLDFKKS